MQTAGIVFLWLNRLYFGGLIVLHLVGLAPREMRRSIARYQVTIAVWQVFGTILVTRLVRSPWHLVWWYGVGWVVLAIMGMITTDVRSSRAKSHTD